MVQHFVVQLNTTWSTDPTLQIPTKEHGKDDQFGQNLLVVYLVGARKGTKGTKGTTTCVIVCGTVCVHKDTNIIPVN